MTDEPITVRQWTDVVRRARLGRTNKAVALMLATYADNDGTRVFPGVARIAVDCEISYNVAQTALSALRAAGLIERVTYGARRRGKSDEYRLLLAADLLDRVEVLTPGQVTVAADRMQTVHAGRHRRPDVDPGQGTLDLHPTPRGAKDDPAEVLHPTPCATEEASPDDLHPTPLAVQPPEPEPFAPHGVGPKPGFAPHGALHLHPTPLATTNHYLATSTTSHPDQELRTAVTPSRAQARQDPDSPRLPDRCAHGLRARRRPDGSSTCALCRVIEAGRTAALPATA